MRQDVVVLGAGLAGLTAARQLARAGSDVMVLEARGRPGGRVEQTELADGRLVQLGGEVVAPFHTAYHELVDDLGLTIVPAFPSLPGQETFVLSDRERLVGDGFPFFGDDDRRGYEQVEEAFRRLAREVNPDEVDPDDPWSHARARELDSVSVSSWLRSQGATPAERAERRRLPRDRPDRRHLDAARGHHVHARAAGALRPVPRHPRGGAGGHGARGDGRRVRRRDPRSPGVFVRRWGADPWTRGYITSWRPGDVMAVGPLQAKHEPPFYACGSDQWVCGYLEGPVRTGRDAARAALGER